MRHYLSLITVAVLHVSAKWRTSHHFTKVKSRMFELIVLDDDWLFVTNVLHDDWLYVTVVLRDARCLLQLSLVMTGCF